MAIKVSKISGTQRAEYLEHVASLRIRVFRDFPYLYDGDPDYEKTYLGRYLQARDFVLILAKDGDRVVGASTCLPLSQETDEIQRPLIRAGYNAENVLYLGESVLDKAYRGKGIGKEFFRLREEHGHELGKKYASFCAVDRPEDHSLRPDHYTSLHGFWQKMGYTPLPRVKATFSWKDIDRAEETDKKLTFWLKRF